MQTQLARSSLCDIPSPSVNHVKALNDMLARDVLQSGRTQREFHACAQMADLLTTLFKQQLNEGCLSVILLFA